MSKFSKKTIQVQGIETLLSEATELGLAHLDSHSTIEPTSIVEDSSSTTESTSTTEATPPNVSEPVAASNDLENATANGAVSSHFIDANDSTPVTTSPKSTPASTQLEQSNGRRQSSKLKPKRDAKSPASKASAAKANKTSNSNRSAREESKSADASDLRQFLQSAFEDKTLAESISEILDSATEPLGMNDLIAQMYDGLSDQNYKRARSSLANILSVGRSKGKWQSAGRGMYAGNAIATA